MSSSKQIFLIQLKKANEKAAPNLMMRILLSVAFLLTVVDLGFVLWRSFNCYPYEVPSLPEDFICLYNRDAKKEMPLALRQKILNDYWKMIEEDEIIERALIKMAFNNGTEKLHQSALTKISEIRSVISGMVADIEYLNKNLLSLIVALKENGADNPILPRMAGETKRLSPPPKFVFGKQPAVKEDKGQYLRLKKNQGTKGSSPPPKFVSRQQPAVKKDDKAQYLREIWKYRAVTKDDKAHYSRVIRKYRGSLFARTKTVTEDGKKYHRTGQE